MTEAIYPSYIPDENYNFGVLDDPKFVAQDYIYKCLFPFFLLFGTIGSIACLILLNKYSHLVWSTCIYLSLLMGTHLMILYTYCGNEWYTQVTKTNLSNDILLLSNSICKVYNFLLSFINNFSSWIIVCVAIELMIAIRFPHHMYRMCTRERAQAVILLIVVLLVCLNLHFFWTQGLTKGGDDPKITQSYCHENYDVPEEFNHIWNYVQLMINDILPMIIVIVCFIVAITILAQPKKPNEDTQTLLSKYFLDLNTLYEMKIATGIMCLLFVPVALSRSTIIFIRMLNEKNYISISYADYIIVETVSRMIEYGYISLKPYIFMSVSSKLRSDLFKAIKKLFKCQKIHSKNKQYRVSNTDCNPSSAMEKKNTHKFSKQGARPKSFTSSNSGTGTITDV